MADPLRDSIRRADHEAKPSNADDIGMGRTPPRSGPVNPKQRVGNGLRSPQPYEDLRVTPNLTGTYFEAKGRYRLFINQAGPHIECLLTLVVGDELRYHEPTASLADDVRIPADWGVCDLKPKRLRGRAVRPIAFRFCGDEMFPRTYHLFVPPWIGSFNRERYQANFDVGELEVKGDDSVALAFLETFLERWAEHRSLAASKATRVDRSPVLLERYLAHPSVPWQVRTQIWFPATPTQRDGMRRMAWAIFTDTVTVDEHARPAKQGKEMSLREILEEFRTLSSSPLDRLRLNNLATSANAIVDQVFDRPYDTPLTKGGFRASHMEEFTKMVFRLLDRARLQGTVDRGSENLISVLQRLMDRADADAADVRAIQKHLGISARGAKAHALKVKFVAADLSIIDMHEFFEDLLSDLGKQVGELVQEKLEAIIEEVKDWSKHLEKVKKYLPTSAYAGVLFVEYEPPPDQFPALPGWKARYGIVLCGLSVKRVFGDLPEAKIDGVGYCYAASPPVPRRLEGPAGFFRADAFAGARADDFFGLDLEHDLGKSGLLLYGDGEPGSGAHLVLDAKMGDISGGAGGYLESNLGYVWLLSQEGGGNLRWVPEGKDPIIFQKYWAEHVGELGVMFPINGARLPIPTPEEDAAMVSLGMLTVQQALQAFAASELPLLTHDLARVVLEGHADRPDTEPRNFELSGNRALSVANYIRGLLGPDVGGLSRRMHVLAKGEPAGPAGRKRPDFDPELRRVDVKVSICATAEEAQTKPREGGPSTIGVESTAIELRQESTSRD